MENTVSRQVEEAKEWVAPELKKVAIAELTARLHLLHSFGDDDPTS